MEFLFFMAAIDLIVLSWAILVAYSRIDDAKAQAAKTAARLKKVEHALKEAGIVLPEDA